MTFLVHNHESPLLFLRKGLLMDLWRNMDANMFDVYRYLTD